VSNGGSSSTERADPARPGSPQPAGGGPLRALLIEDSEIDAALIAQELRKGGYDLARARVSTLETAVQALEREEWDVVLCDSALAGIDPRDVLQLIRNKHLDIPFIVVADTRGVEAAVHAVRAGANDFVVKDRLKRLVPIVGRELREAERRRDFRRSEEALHAERSFTSALLETTGALVIIHDPQGRIIRVNGALEKITGRSLEEVRGREVWDVFHAPEDREAARETFAALSTPAPPRQHESGWIGKDGAQIQIVWSDAVLRNAAGGITHVISTGIDVTESRKLADKLLRDAFYDPLTGLPNRTLFMDRVGQWLRHAERHKERRFAVLLLDLDRFKLVNDSLGHNVGDQLLVETARRLQACVRPGDTVARLGGDEFAMLLSEVHDAAGAIHVAQRIQKGFRSPVKLGSREVFATLSTGIALGRARYSRPEDIVRDADTAMHRAKARGRDRQEVFDSLMHANAISRLQLETDLRLAIEREQIEVVYQPIVSLAGLNVCGFEALARWSHPERGAVSPGDFVPVAEETGLIVPIDRYVLRRTCRQMKEWKERHPHLPPLAASVNLSGREFSRPDLVDDVESALRDSGLEASALTLEVTESALMESAEFAAQMLWKLRMIGVKLSLDDFGTGYSSFNYLHRFPFNGLKIDRSFVKAMQSGGEGQEIVGAIVTLAHSLGLKVVAEGVETAEQLERLRALGCGYAQGYYFFRPATPEEMDNILANQPRAKADPA
jgi:diguanylate cyclase (GGDEF)-like protein/PAS domain S-box-containing protein